MTEMVQATHAIPVEWSSEAEEMGLPRSEYLRRMVRAGRLQWGFDHTEETEQPTVNLHDSVNAPPDEIAAVLENTITRNLSTSDGVSENTLLDYVIGDLEEQIVKHLESLKDEDKVEYRPSDGGWVKN